MNFHGLIAEVIMWNSTDEDVERLYREGNPANNSSMTTWDTSSVLIWAPNDSVQSLVDVQQSHELMLNVTTVNCADEMERRITDQTVYSTPVSTTTELLKTTTVATTTTAAWLRSTTTTTKRIEPVIAPRTHTPIEATGSQAYGSVCIIAVGALIGVIVFSDLRYFERVLPIMRRNMRTGISRIHRAIARQSIVRGMVQLLTLTKRLADNDHNSRADNGEFERLGSQEETTPYCNDAKNSVGPPLKESVNVFVV